MTGCLHCLRSCLLIKKDISCTRSLVKSVRLLSSSSLRHKAPDKIELKFQEKLKEAKERDATYRISSLDCEKRERLNWLQFEYEVLKAEGQYEIPEYMTSSNWMWLLTSEQSLERRLEIFVSIKDSQEKLQKQNQKEKQQLLELENLIQSTESGIIQNSCFYVDKNHLKNSFETHALANEARGLQFGRQAVIEYIGENSKNAVEYAKFALLKNRKHGEPFSINFTNCVPSNSALHTITKFEENFPFVQYHADPAVEVFDKERLVFIDVASPNTLDDFNYNDIPVFLRFTHFNTNETVMDIAERAGVRHAALPIRKYIKFSANMRNIHLPLFQSLGILMDMNLSHNWPESIMNNLDESTRARVHSVTDLYNYIYSTKRRKHMSMQRIPVKRFW